MTKKLEETFNLPNISEISQDDIKNIQNNNVLIVTLYIKTELIVNE